MSDDAVLSGTPCIRGTRIPVHDIADMLANGDDVEAVCEAYPRLSAAQVEAASFHARVWPRQIWPDRGPDWRKGKPLASSVTTLDALRTAG